MMLAESIRVRRDADNPDTYHLDPDGEIVASYMYDNDICHLYRLADTGHVIGILKTDDDQP